MADTKITQKPEATTLVDADELVVVTDIATVPVTKRSLFSTVVTYIVSAIHAATSKATPVDNDELLLIDSAASYVKKRLTWSNLKATLKTYFDTVYAPISPIVKFVLFGHGGLNTVGSGATTYLGFTGGLGAEQDIRIISPIAGTLKNFRVTTRSAQSGTGSLVFTIRVAGADTAVTVTVSAGAAANVFADITHTASVSAGQGVDVSILNNASANSATIGAWSVELDPS